MEIWKPIPGYEKYYDVSNQGEVRSKERLISYRKISFIKKPRILKKTKTTTGYWKVELKDDEKRKSFKVHRLVAMAFIENPERKPNINHIDGNPLNNDVSNLEWCTQSENVFHAYQIGLHPSNLHKYEEEIIQRYTDDHTATMKSLSREFKCSELSLKKMLIRKGIKPRTTAELRDKYKIDRKKLIKDFKQGLRNKDIAAKYKTNTALIATYRYKYKKGELSI